MFGRALKDGLKSGKVLKAFGLGQLFGPKFVEIVAQTGGYDAVWLDQEHTGVSIAEIERACLAARAANIPAFVRLTATDYATVMRALEAGAGGVMAAQVRSAAEAKKIAGWTYFTPLGERGVNGSGADGRFGTIPLESYMAQANEGTFLAIQIEHIDAVNDVEAIAKIPGVDILFIGPADLAASMGLVGKWEDPKLWAAYQRVADAAKAAGIAWGIMPRNPEQMKRCVGMGARMIFVGMDIWAFQRGLKSFAAEFAV